MNTATHRQKEVRAWVVHVRRHREHDALIRLVGQDIGACQVFCRGMFRTSKKRVAGVERVHTGDYGMVGLKQSRSGDTYRLNHFEPVHRLIELGDTPLWQAQCSYLLEWHEQISRMPTPEDDAFVLSFLLHLKQCGADPHISACLLRGFEFALLTRAGVCPEVIVRTSWIGDETLYYRFSEGEITRNAVSDGFAVDHRTVELMQLIQQASALKLAASLSINASDIEQKTLKRLGQIFMQLSKQLGCRMPASAKMLRALRNPAI